MATYTTQGGTGGIKVSKKCAKECEVYSRIVGYFRPVQQWNIGKREEFKDRLEYSEEKSLGHEFRKGGSER